MSVFICKRKYLSARILIALCGLLCIFFLTTASFVFANFGAPANAACDKSPWVWPISPAHITKPFEKPPQNWLPGHRGVDLAASEEQDILAPQDGVVKLVQKIANTPIVVIDHQNGLRSTFQPASSDLKVGDPVKKGDVVGKVDAKDDFAQTHCTLEHCIHWGVKKGDDYINPAALVNCCPVVLLR
jgi:murein DD-endopeptidase MepM/ murein hydrolase activator NlpD